MEGGKGRGADQVDGRDAPSGNQGGAQKKARAKTVLKSIVTTPNNGIQEIRTRRLADGTTEIKKKWIRRPCFRVPVPTRKTVPAVPASVAAPQTKTARERARKAAKAPVAPAKPKTAEPATVRERMHDKHGFAQDLNVSERDQHRMVLKKAKAYQGAHTDSFVQDYQLAHGGGLRSPSLEGAGGGSAGVPLPLARVQAVDRLKALQEARPACFTIAEAVLIYGARAADIAKMDGGPDKRSAHTMIQHSMDGLAEFYTPQAKKKDRRLASFAQFVEEERRRAKL